MKRIKYLIITGFIIFFKINFTLAANSSPFQDGLDKTAARTGHKGLPLLTKTPAEIIGTAIGYALAFVGVLLLILVIYGGYLWMTARGNEQQVEKAKNILRDSVIGLIIILGAYAITQLISGSVIINK